MQEISIIAIISVAFLSSFSHCIGMCGGFMGLFALSLRDESRSKAIFLNFTYHISRTFSYCVLGAICGAFGSVLIIDIKSKALLFFTIGLFLVFIAIALFMRGKLLKFIENDTISKFITSKISKFKGKNFINFVVLGLLNGLLPCGVVYYFLAMAILSENALNGVIIMALFGLSTIPAMMIFGILFKFVNEKFKQIMFKITLCIILLNGVYLTYLGFMANG